ncbi:MAG: AAA family ATPase [Candidatus Margulisbacteria bacterium]|nr:AAA family ATPase [Candidatus Margulisiibacteriota bacterium]
MEKVSTGIEGVDRLLSGGLPKGKSYLVAGEPGTGKTLFCLQYLLEGAKKGEKCIYISIDERPEHIIFDAESMGWPIKTYLEDGSLSIFDVTNYFSTPKLGHDEGINIDQIINDILGHVKKMGASRLCIDPIAPLILTEQHLPEVSTYIRKLVFAIEDNAECTTLLTSHVPVGSGKLSQHGIEEFISSGIISLQIAKVHNKNIRTIWIRKIRGVKLDLSDYHYDILPERGIVLRQAV